MSEAACAASLGSLLETVDGPKLFAFIVETPVVGLSTSDVVIGLLERPPLGTPFCVEGAGLEGGTIEGATAVAGLTWRQLIFCDGFPQRGRHSFHSQADRAHRDYRLVLCSSHRLVKNLPMVRSCSASKRISGGKLNLQRGRVSQTDAHTICGCVSERRRVCLMASTTRDAVDATDAMTLPRRSGSRGWRVATWGQ